MEGDIQQIISIMNKLQRLLKCYEWHREKRESGE